MHEPMERCVQLGLVAAMAYPAAYQTRPDEVCLALARDDFFTVAEVNPVADAKLRAQAARYLNEAHMTVCYGAQARLLGGGLNPNALDESERLLAERALLEGLEEAQAWGAQRIAFLAGRFVPESREPALDQLVKTTRNLCARAADVGLMVELEVFDYDVDKRSLIGPSALAGRLAAQVRSHCANFGLMIDLSHIPMCYEQPKDVVRQLRPYISHVHIGNTVMQPGCDAYGDEHPRFGYPASSNDTPELSSFLAVLHGEGLLSPDEPMILSLEVKPRPFEDPDIVLASSKRVLRRAWALASR